MLRRQRHAPLEPFAAAPASVDRNEGRRLAVLVGCLEGCHGPAGEGGEVVAPGIFRLVAPTLSDVLPEYSDTELARLVRYGVRRDGSTALGMPSGTFYPLADADLAAIFAHLRTLPASPPVPPERRLYLKARIALITGLWETSADAATSAGQNPRWGELPRETSHDRGRYLASVVCSECHGLDYRGKEYEQSPPLSVVRSYDLEQFAHLLRTGETLSGAKDGLMSRVARSAFVQFTPQEVADLYEFLRTLEPPGK